MRRRAMWTALTLGALVGVVAEAGAGYLVWGRRGQPDRPPAAVSARSGAGPRAARGPRLAVLPPDATVVEVRRLDRVELDDLEVGREVEVARRDDGGQLAPEDGRVRWRRASEEAVDQAPRRGRGRRRRGRGQDREADVLEGAADDARADDLRREAAPELERAAAEAARDQAHREEVACQVEDVLHVVAEPDLRDHLVEDALEILALEPDRAADAKVEA